MHVKAVVPDRRRQRAERSRAAMGEAALDLLLERGLGGVTVEEIARRAGVTRRTFSRHFPGKADAVLAVVADDVHRINDALRERPPAEPPLIAYRNAVCGWLASDYGDGPAAGGRLRRRLALHRRIAGEPQLAAAYQRIRMAGEQESVRIVAARLDVDPELDPRPAVAVGAGVGILVAVLRAWARRGIPESPAALAAEHFAALDAVTRMPGPPQEC
ncbi:TetR/AcrR family transcriptional regulator [Yinghuangia soli]|uniref:TetR/AcrR family transcriptional regulator n=1 Tax=Yinghuangia soli TaxID=2908204 RepID=A0AA41Q2S6_9ACTN|nr:TetR/AcrR family transcriptional regulator [Yinghuangia soli]MCF2530261.1 TetR/AcrR family transcriptional regulator [Yinghuangia soli]